MRLFFIFLPQTLQKVSVFILYSENGMFFLIGSAFNFFYIK